MERDIEILEGILKYLEICHPESERIGRVKEEIIRRRNEINKVDLNVMKAPKIMSNV